VGEKGKWIKGRKSRSMRKFLVISSEKDPAGSNIKQRLIESFGFRATESNYDSSPVYTFENILLASSMQEIINIGSDLDTNFPTGKEDDLQYIFVSKHRAESRVPSLTAHFPGNFSSNDFGGSPGEISKYSPSLLKHYMLALNSLKVEIPSQYEITLEATHHGPTSLQRPSMFVELGSTPDQWGDRKAATCIAKALIKSLKDDSQYEKCAIALGGTHYPEKFNKVIFESEIALGVIVPKYALESLDAKMLTQILQKSTEKISVALLDSKGLGKEKNRVIDLIKTQGLEILKA
jgi:D-aminoacyl-tRNA deacylase